MLDTLFLARVSPPIAASKLRNANKWPDLDKIADDKVAAAVDEVMRLKPSAAKGRYIKKAVVSTTMGPGIQVDPTRSRDV